LNVKYYSSITTNGFLLEESVVDTLLACDVKTFQVTIDGPKELHDKQRRSKDDKDTYKTIKRNLINMKKKSGNFSVVLRTNVSPELIPVIS
jgi:uncharacterized protein